MIPLRHNDKSRRRVTRFAFLAVAAAVVLGPVLISAHHDVFLSLSGSAPRGFWRLVEHDVHSPHTLGSWVVVCPPLTASQHRQLYAEKPPNAGECRSKLSLKQIAAVPGDRVIIDHPMTITPLVTVEAVSTDPTGSLLPRPTNGEYVLAPETYWVINPHPRSVDSRYFGPVSTDAISAGAFPLWTVP